MTQLNRVLHILAAIILLAVLLVSRAHADPLLSQSTMLSGTYSGVFTFSTSQAGVLNLRLENIAWPERLSALSCNLYDHDTEIGSLATDGTLSIEVSGAHTFFTHLFAQASGTLDLGIFSLNVSFTPNVSAVPLPGAFWLLGSFLGLFGLRRTALPILKFALARSSAA